MPLARLLDPDAYPRPLKYAFDVRLGRGTFGVVYSATVQPAGHELAVKVFKDGASARRQAIEEAGTLEKCAHVCIVPLYDAWWEAKTKIAYFVFPRMETDLERLLRSNPHGVTPAMGRDILYPVGCAFDHVHRLGVIHRDVKPANILLRSSKGSYDVLLGDLGAVSEAGHHRPLVNREPSFFEVPPGVSRAKLLQTAVDWRVGTVR